jgi:DNA (cytosine-5)-methyltransferase 1
MKVVDLFAGCGGLSLGMQQAGFDVVAAFDYWKPAVDTYEFNFNHPVYRLDLTSNEIIDKISFYDPDMIVGGPPCQDFSSAGKRDEDNGRGDLTISYANIIETYRPKFFIMENVERILKTRKLVEFKRIVQNAGYFIYDEVLDASKFGVPQIRKRYFMIGGLSFDKSIFKHRLACLISDKSLTVREYLGDEIDVSYYYRHPRSYSRRAIFSIDEPSPTIRGVNRPIPKGYLGHPGDAIDINSVKDLRPLSVTERARIQTFPQNFVFLGSKTEQEQMIGNAVPVQLSYSVGQAFIQYYAQAHSESLSESTFI